MLQQNFYPGKAIQVWNNNNGGTSKDDDADIPNPSYLVEELTGSTTASPLSVDATLIDATATFLDDLAANKFAIGDTVYQTKTYKHSRIVSVDSQTQLTVFDATFFPNPFASPIEYQIYRKSPYGCILLMDTLMANDPLEVTDLNNNAHVLTQGQGGLQVLPFQVRKVVHGKTDGKGNIFALFQ